MSKHAVTLTDQNFEELVLKSDKPVLVDFWAQWCGPCLNIAPAIEELAQEFDGKVVVGKLDVDANPVVASQFGIRSIPTLLVIKNGVVVDKQIGASPKSVLKQKLEKVS
jgi:thioredoxin 1